MVVHERHVDSPILLGGQGRLDQSREVRPWTIGETLAIRPDVVEDYPGSVLETHIVINQVLVVLTERRMPGSVLLEGIRAEGEIVQRLREPPILQVWLWQTARYAKG